MVNSGLKLLALSISVGLGIRCQSQENRQLILEQVAEGQTLPKTSWLIDIDGDTISYQSLKGKWLLVDYWSYGCKPCIKEFPKINKKYKEIDRDKLEIIGVFVGKDPNKWKKSLKKFPLAYPSYYGGWTQSNPMLAINFQLTDDDQIMTSTPQYVLIDPEGKIVNKNLPKPSDPSFDQVLYSYIGAFR